MSALWELGQRNNTAAPSAAISEDDKLAVTGAQANLGGDIAIGSSGEDDRCALPVFSGTRPAVAPGTARFSTLGEVGDHQ